MWKTQAEGLSRVRSVCVELLVEPVVQFLTANVIGIEIFADFSAHETDAREELISFVGR